MKTITALFLIMVLLPQLSKAGFRTDCSNFFSDIQSGEVTEYYNFARQTYLPAKYCAGATQNVASQSTNQSIVTFTEKCSSLNGKTLKTKLICQKQTDQATIFAHCNLDGVEINPCMTSKIDSLVNQ